MVITESKLRNIIREELKKFLVNEEQQQSQVQQNLEYVKQELQKFAETAGVSDLPEYFTSTVSIGFDPIKLIENRFASRSELDSLVSNGTIPKMGIKLNTKYAPKEVLDKLPSGYVKDAGYIMRQDLKAKEDQLYNNNYKLFTVYQDLLRGLQAGQQSFGMTKFVVKAKKAGPEPLGSGRGIGGQYGNLGATASDYTPSTIRANPNASAGT
jgi:hypothetical protein